MPCRSVPPRCPGARPHRPCGRQAGARVLGPLGARRQRRHDEADHRLGAEEPGGGHHRLHERRQQAGDHRRGRGAGEDRPRRDRAAGVGGAQSRPRVRAGRRRGAAADREIRPDQRGERIPRQGERPLDGGAEQLGLAEPAARGPHQRAEGQGRAGRAVDVSGERRVHAGRRCLDMGCASEGGRGLSEGGHAVRARAVECR